MQVECSKCREPIAPEFDFCENCGWPTHATASSDTASASASDLARRCVCGRTTFDPDGYCESCGRKVELADQEDIQSIDDIAASASHRGRKHPDNQDAAGLRALPDGGIALVVADGVSTACRAREAADTAVHVILEMLACAEAAPPATWLEQAVVRAHAAICALPYDDARLAEPQTTVVVALVRGDAVWYAWVGDSRLYLLQPEGSRQLSEDDSWLNDRLREGVPFDTASADPDAHAITQCLGMRDSEPVIHMGCEPLTPQSQLLLCSDGLWNYLGQAESLERHARASASEPVARQCSDLVALANRAGGADNITVALYRHQPAGS
jgi:serine/threonine protein phosphatase PrpC